MRKKIKVREGRIDDLEGMLLVEEEAWPKGLRASREMFECRLKTFPQGTFVAEAGGKIEGVVVTEILNSDLINHIRTWDETTDNGYIRNTHNPEGDTIYGVNLSVSPCAQKRVAIALLEAIEKLIIRYSLKQGLLSGRIPGFAKYFKQYCQKKNLSSVSNEERDKVAEQYLWTTTSHGRALDPEIDFYKKRDFKMIKLLPGYIEDPQSLNYGVLFLWTNPFYGKPFPKFWSWLFRVK
ncbi:hypothetical protein KAV79_09230 [Candidatus Aerophobetes bacterium]|nr:hypothetical protein [Candidatus Aerophobetes bacterium]